MNEIIKFDGFVLYWGKWWGPRQIRVTPQPQKIAHLKKKKLMLFTVGEQETFGHLSTPRETFVRLPRILGDVEKSPKETWRHRDVSTSPRILGDMEMFPPLQLEDMETSRHLQESLETRRRFPLSSRAPMVMVGQREMPCPRLFVPEMSPRLLVLKHPHLENVGQKEGKCVSVEH